MLRLRRTHARAGGLHREPRRENAMAPSLPRYGVARCANCPGDGPRSQLSGRTCIGLGQSGASTAPRWVQLLESEGTSSQALEMSAGIATKIAAPGPSMTQPHMTAEAWRRMQIPVLLDRSRRESLTTQIVDQLREAIRCARIRRERACRRRGGFPNSWRCRATPCSRLRHC